MTKHTTLDKKNEDPVLIKVMDELMKEAVWVGEDGNMVCNSDSERGAWIKFKRLMKQDVGDLEVASMKEDGQVGIGWLHRPTAEQLDEWGDEIEWWVSTKKTSPYFVWFYQVN